MCIVEKLEVSSDFCKRHASCSLSLLPLVRMVETIQASICKLDFAFGSAKTKAKNF